MPALPGTRKRSDPAREDEGARDLSASVEELQAEIAALRRENAELRLADSERKQVKEALQQSEARFRAAQELSPDGFTILRPVRDTAGNVVDFTWVYENDAVARMNGTDPKAVVGKSLLALFPGHQGSKFFEMYVRTAVTGEMSIFEEVYRGETITNSTWFRIVVVRIDGDIAILAQDVTDRKRAEEAQLESERKYRQLFESMGEGFVLHEMVYDDEGRPVDYLVLDVNPAYEKITGLRREDVVGKGITELIPVIEPAWFEQYDGVVRFGRAMRFEDYNAGFDRWYSIYAFPTPGENQFAVIFTDITERKRAEEALRRHAEDLARLQSELEASNREANLYLDILTHDIGNTENVSNLYAELLADTLEGEAAGYMENLQRSIRKSIEILSTVSTIRRIHQTSSELMPIDLDAVVQGVLEDYPGSTICYNGAHHQVRADNLLSVIFNNLIGNAVKHGGPDTEIAVRVEEEDGSVRVSIEDTGPGVPDDEKHEIFHRYEKKKRGVGEGLGLYLVQILVERYGGRVWAEDRVPGYPEHGAAFRFTLRKVA
ncbi:PAS domain S-box protein [Methanoculleus sp. Wushi-C6]|uniref:histidine kinase n=1 Tax=Methanoculleus caldifontis TaxID=2651577 RepID=A0ABU3X3A3_9EURY|nr:PAS domain-containing sensor histidine kinase [Methanoculleus sp. Wushi-C6]MDV2482514.1 PAS domain S-box protein [Methanoculleus sp. Wushi-C6]